MTNYVFKHSDPAAGSFLVQADQIDGTSRPGNAALYINPVSGLSAISANSSLVFAGQGIVDYGELVQNNLIYLMEHFAYATRPLKPVQGQIWYKNAAGVDPSFPSDPSSVGLYLWTGSLWTPIITGAGGVLDMGGARVANVGDAISAGDAVSRGYADARYLQLSGGTMTGAVMVASGNWTFNSGVSLSVTNAPTTSLHVANKAYVDAASATSAGLVSTEATTRAAADSALSSSISTINSQLPNFVQVTGDTMTGTLSIDSGGGIVALNGSGTISFGSRRLQLVGDPILNTDAANRIYVDTAIATAIAGVGAGSSDGVVVSGDLNSSTGVLTLQRSMGLSDVVVVGSFAPFSHAHPATAVTYDLSYVYPQSYLTTSEVGDTGFPNVQLQDIIRTIDQNLTTLNRCVVRKLAVGDGITTTYSVGAVGTYTVGDNRLQVFVDGVKQYASEHGISTVVFTDTGIGYRSVIPGVTGAPLVFNIAVDSGPPTTVSIPTGAGYTYLQYFIDLQAAFSTLSIPAQVRADQFFDRIELYFVSNTSGAGSSVLVSNTAGQAFTVITTASAPVNTSVTTSYSYSEVGNPGADSTSITFNVAPDAGSVVEFLTFPA